MVTVPAKGTSSLPITEGRQSPYLLNDVAAGNQREFQFTGDPFIGLAQPSIHLSLILMIPGKFRMIAVNFVGPGFLQIEPGFRAVVTDTVSYTHLDVYKRQARTQLDAQQKLLDDKSAELQSQQDTLNANRAELDANAAVLQQTIDSTEAQFSSAEAELADARAQYADGVQELADAKQKLADGQKEYEEKMCIRDRS